jgi:hypothetical protein
VLNLVRPSVDLVVRTGFRRVVLIIGIGVNVGFGRCMGLYFCTVVDAEIVDTEFVYV